MRYVSITSSAFFLGLVAILVSVSSSKCDEWVVYLLAALVLVCATLAVVSSAVHFGMSAAVELIEHGEMNILHQKHGVGDDDEDDGEL